MLTAVLQKGDVTVAGFFGLFGKKTKYVDDADNSATSQDSQNNLDDFFLGDDDAKSLGNMEGMRSPNADVPQNGANEQTRSSGESTKSENRSTDSDMELWRNMARNLKR
ncbi:MAG: hypothetical protein SW833_08350 [Cyanobacteriota bacterium]|nr:hypothetical protein [Cyanobacteriota bacterium]